MVCTRVTFHENDRNHENDENDEATPTARNKELSAGLAEITESTENDENHGNPGCKPRVPQTTGLEIPETSFSGHHKIARETPSVLQTSLTDASSNYMDTQSC